MNFALAMTTARGWRVNGWQDHRSRAEQRIGITRARNRIDIFRRW